MQTREGRNERMQRVLLELRAAVMWVQGESNALPSLHDADGNMVVEIPQHLVEVIDDVSDGHAGSIVEALADCVSLTAGQSFRDGVTCGQRTATDSFHDLLGINKLCDALGALRHQDRR